jgi:hypothetical protein
MNHPPKTLISATAMLLLPFLLPLLLFGFVVVDAAGTDSKSRSISIMNESGRRVEVHWINPDNGSMVLQSTPDILNGASMSLNSFVGHNFEVRELPAKKTGVCGGEDETCRVDHFTVKATQDQGESSPPLSSALSRASWRFVHLNMIVILLLHPPPPTLSKSS